MLIPVLTSLSNARDAVSTLLKDATGAYNVSTNPGGYGAPNITSPPDVIGFTFRKWSGTAPYGNVAYNDDDGIISALVGTGGYQIEAEAVAALNSVFSSGVHQIKYYVGNSTDSGTATMTLGSKLVTVAGADPTAFDTAYKAVILLDGSGVPQSNVLLLDRTVSWTSTTFYLTEAWSAATIAGLHIRLCTEADLKILFVELANQCTADAIGSYSRRRRDCDPETVNQLMEMVAWIKAAQVKFECLDYDGANDLLEMLDATCAQCNALICQSCL